MKCSSAFTKLDSRICKALLPNLCFGDVFSCFCFSSYSLSPAVFPFKKNFAGRLLTCSKMVSGCFLYQRRFWLKGCGLVFFRKMIVFVEAPGLLPSPTFLRLIMECFLFQVHPLLKSKSYMPYINFPFHISYFYCNIFLEILGESPMKNVLNRRIHIL